MKHQLLFISLILISFTSCKTIKLTEIEERYVLNDAAHDKYYLINLIREKQKAGVLGEAPALFIEGRFINDSFSKIENIDIKKSDIHSIEILEVEKSIKIYGSRGKYGFINIHTTGWTKPLP